MMEISTEQNKKIIPNVIGILPKKRVQTEYKEVF